MSDRVDALMDPLQATVPARRLIIVELTPAASSCRVVTTPYCRAAITATTSSGRVVRNVSPEEEMSGTSG
jgi:hypothetical protein